MLHVVLVKTQLFLQLTGPLVSRSVIAEWKWKSGDESYIYTDGLLHVFAPINIDFKHQNLYKLVIWLFSEHHVSQQVYKQDTAPLTASGNVFHTC